MHPRSELGYWGRVRNSLYCWYSRLSKRSGDAVILMVQAWSGGLEVDSSGLACWFIGTTSCTMGYRRLWDLTVTALHVDWMFHPADVNKTFLDKELLEVASSSNFGFWRCVLPRSSIKWRAKKRREVVCSTHFAR
jgi:hypothetical protein